ncbi:hypothetical protein KUCAC02_022163 [Chaenocephalus aceratus]|nr:hypothetical protein KUCAC02_022163 [Chaenocephalus aceratus]
MNGKSTNGSLGGMACIEGLPPLPKSLSGLLNSSGGSWRDMERMYVKKTMIQDDLSRGRNDNLLSHKPANLDAALALLRKEMPQGFNNRVSVSRWGSGSRHVPALPAVVPARVHPGLQGQLPGPERRLQPQHDENGYFDEDDEDYPEPGATPTGERPDGELGDGTGKKGSGIAKDDSWDSFHVNI